MNFDKFLHIISKWPVDASRGKLDFGLYLRELVKKKDVSGNVFPGTSAENAKKLNALLRLLNNTYDNKYPCKKKKGGSGLDMKSVNAILSNKKYVMVAGEKVFKSEFKDKKGEEPKSDETTNQ